MAGEPSHPCVVLAEAEAEAEACSPRPQPLWFHFHNEAGAQDAAVENREAGWTVFSFGPLLTLESPGEQNVSSVVSESP